MSIETLIAKDEIRDVVLRLARGMDRNDRALILAAYHPGALDHHGEFDGPVEQFVEWIELLHRERVRKMLHLITNHLITVDGDSAHGEAAVFSVLRSRDKPRTDLIGAGRYLDHYDRRDGQWKLAERTVIVDWYRSESVNHNPDTMVSIHRGGRVSTEDPSYHLLGW